VTVSGQRLSKHVPATTNSDATIELLLETVFSVVRAATLATQRRGKYASTTIEWLCFLLGLYKGVIRKTIAATQSVES
jgi:hypothetical protein